MVAVAEKPYTGKPKTSSAEPGFAVFTYSETYVSENTYSGVFGGATESPFGQTIALTGDKKDEFSFWFSSKYEDTETGLYYYGYRSYSPTLGRWLSRDPIGEKIRVRKKHAHQSGPRYDLRFVDPNLYAFVKNVPTMSIDPVGLMDWGILGPKCCNNNTSTEYACVNGSWVSLAPGKCTGICDDCDGMTCKGGFYALTGLTGTFLIGGNCTTGPDDWYFSSRRWTPTGAGTNAQSPSQRGCSNAGPPGYTWGAP